MRPDEIRVLAVLLLAAGALLGLPSPSAADGAIEIAAHGVDSAGRAVALVGEEVLLQATGDAASYRWRRGPDDDLGEGAELRLSDLPIGEHEIVLVADGEERARAPLVVRRTPIVVLGGWSGELDAAALRELPRDYDTGYRDEILDPLADDGIAANAWLDVFGVRPLHHAYAPVLAEVIRELRYRTGVDRVDVVARGVEGLLVRWLVARGEGHGIRRVVHLGTPSHGTDLGAPTMRILEQGAGFVGATMRTVLEGLVPADGAELAKLTQRIAEGVAPPHDGRPERLAATLAALRSVDLAPHSSFLRALNGHRGLRPGVSERTTGGVPEPVELALTATAGPTASHQHVFPPGLDRSFAVPTLVPGDRAVAAEGVPRGDLKALWLEPEERVSHVDLDAGHELLRPRIRDFLLDPSPAQVRGTVGEEPEEPARAILPILGEARGFWPPYPHDYHFTVDPQVERVLLTFFSPGQLGLRLKVPGRNNKSRLLLPNDRRVTTTRHGFWTELRVAYPPRGQWRVGVQGEKGASYAFAAFLDTGSFLGVSLSEYSVLPDAPLSLLVWAGERPEASFRELVARVWPWGSDTPFEVELHDDGAHGDGEAGDGLYGGTFRETAKEGSFLVIVDSVIADEGHSYRRWAYERFVVEALPDLEISDLSLLLCGPEPMAARPSGVAVLVKNRGDGDASGAAIDLYAGDPAAGGRLLGRDVVDVRAGESEAARFYWLPEPGEQRLYARVSPFNPFLEKSYANNVARRTVRVASSPDAPAGAAPAEAGPRLAILSPPPGALLGERAVVTVRAASPALSEVSVEVDGRSAGSCAAQGRTRILCHVPLDTGAVEGSRLRLAVVAQGSDGSVSRREATYKIDRKPPKLRVKPGARDVSGKVGIAYRVRDKNGTGEILASSSRAAAHQGAAGELDLTLLPGGPAPEIAAFDAACNVTTIPLPAAAPAGERTDEPPPVVLPDLGLAFNSGRHEDVVDLGLALGAAGAMRFDVIAQSAPRTVDCAADAGGALDCTVGDLRRGFSDVEIEAAGPAGPAATLAVRVWVGLGPRLFFDGFESGNLDRWQ